MILLIWLGFIAAILLSILVLGSFHAYLWLLDKLGHLPTIAELLPKRRS